MAFPLSGAAKGTEQVTDEWCVLTRRSRAQTRPYMTNFTAMNIGVDDQLPEPSYGPRRLPSPKTLANEEWNRFRGATAVTRLLIYW